MKYLFTLLLLLFITSSCMINDDWHTHRFEYNYDTNSLTIDGEVTTNFTLSNDNVGITIYFPETIEHFDWHFNTLNEYGVRYDVTIDGDYIFIAHDFNKYNNGVFVAMSYLAEEHIHFMFNLN